MRIPKGKKVASPRRSIRSPMQGSSIEQTISHKIQRMDRWISLFQANIPEHLSMHQITRFIRFIENTRGYLMEHWKEIIKMQEKGGGGPARDILSAFTNILQAYSDSPDTFINDLLRGGDGSILFIARDSLRELRMIFRDIEKAA